jgi:hypothetical protein
VLARPGLAPYYIDQLITPLTPNLKGLQSGESWDFYMLRVSIYTYQLIYYSRWAGAPIILYIDLLIAWLAATIIEI